MGWKLRYARGTRIYCRLLKSDHCGMETIELSVFFHYFIIKLKSDHCGMETSPQDCFFYACNVKIRPLWDGNSSISMNSPSSHLVRVKIRPLWDGNTKKWKLNSMKSFQLKSDHCGMETIIKIRKMLKSDLIKRKHK